MNLITHRRVFSKHQGCFLIFPVFPVFSTFYFFRNDFKTIYWFKNFNNSACKTRGAIMNIFKLKTREGPPEPTGPPDGTGPPGCGPPSGAGPPGKKNQPQRCRDGPGRLEKKIFFTFLTNEILMKRGIQP